MVSRSCSSAVMYSARNLEVTLPELLWDDGTLSALVEIDFTPAKNPDLSLAHRHFVWVRYVIYFIFDVHSYGERPVGLFYVKSRAISLPEW